MRRSVLASYMRDVLEPTVRAELERTAVEQRDEDGVVRVDLVYLCRRIFLRLAAATIGFDNVVSPEDCDRLTACLYPLIEGSTIEWATEDHAEVMRRAQAAKIDFYEQFCVPAIERRRKLIRTEAPGELPNDLITIMMTEVERGEHLEGTVRECILFLVATTLNNVAATINTIEELMQLPEGHPAPVHDLDFLRLAVQETLRLNSVTPAVIRRASKDVTLSSGRSVKEGETLALDLDRANHSEVFGADADSFNPHRELPGGIKPYGLAFGAGVHVCLGRPLVVGSYSDDPGDGLVVHVLSHFFAAGVRKDPTRAEERPQTAQNRHQTFPALFANL
jgi:cytochrome P450